MSDLNKTSIPLGWPERMDTNQAAAYLEAVHGLPVKPKTLRNWRCSGRRGPTWRYLGTLPIADRAELDRWAAEDALTDESPVSRTRRLARDAMQQSAAA